MLATLRITRRPPLLYSTYFARRHLTTLGIRREDPGRIWERRAPLTPEDVARLRDDVASRGGDELRVLVQTCRRRCFSDDQYARSGAEVVEELEDADLVLGLKEPPLSQVHSLTSISKERRWMMFSHTHKGQEYNIPLLSAFLDPVAGQTLIDHELLTVPAGSGLKRVAAFGWFAGAVGAGEGLSATGLGLLRRGIAHPLLHLPRPYTYASLEKFRAALAEVGRVVASSPPTRAPIVIGLTGAGNVAEGARAMLDSLGARWVLPEELPNLELSSCIYACAIPPRAYLERVDGTYDRTDYYSSPSAYRSVFAEKIAPYVSCLINGAGWQPGFPRILSDSDMDVLTKGGEQHLVAVQDVSCDMKGGLEFVDRHTTIDSPSFEGPGGILIGSTDILPSELPADASRHFSERIYPYVLRAVLGEADLDSIDETIKRATIVRHGHLTPAHTALGHKVAAWRQTAEAVNGQSSIQTPSSSMRKEKKRVLLLGSGLVAGPAVNVFLDRPDIALTIVSNNLTEATALSRGLAATALLDVSDEQALSEAVKAAEVVVSLLPAPMHVPVARQCIKHKRHLVTASYISPEMKALDSLAKDAGVTLLGECGLDPGIDSMAAMRILDRAAKQGLKVESFVSWCGGLPEPTAADVPLGYKFSWSPKAVLTAALNDARFKLNGEIREIAGDQLLASHFHDVDLWRGLKLEGLANRDALPYVDKYGLGQLDEIRNVFRGTLRYPGFSTLLDALRHLGLLSDRPLVADPTTAGKSARPPSSWVEMVAACASREGGEFVGVDEVEVYARMVVARAGGGEREIEAMRWLSLLPPSSETPVRGPSGPVLARLRNGEQTLITAPIDLLAGLLASKLAYGSTERDTVLLHHAFEFIPSSSSTQPRSLSPDPTSGLVSGSTFPASSTLSPVNSTIKVTASLACTGTLGPHGASAMATTVGATLAIAALRVVDGDVKVKGVTGPYEREVWSGVLPLLEERGVVVNETW